MQVEMVIIGLISIHALLAESDIEYSDHYRFLEDISIHALLAESDSSSTYCPMRPSGISIHALLAESDFESVYVLFWGSLFQSTLSLRRATGPIGTGRRGVAISIHALLAESDPRKRPWKLPVTDFNPRSPCGERPPDGFALSA